MTITRRTGAVLGVVVAAVLVAAGTTAAVGLDGRDGADVAAATARAGAEPSDRSAGDPSAATPAATPSAEPSPGPALPTGSASVPAPWVERPSTLAPVRTAPPAAAAAPVQVSVPSLGITSPLLHLGLQVDGSLEVPQGADFDTAAWYDGSPRPGDTGPAVIEGHVSSRSRGPSVFHALSAVAVGARVDVLREDGTTASFEVYDVQQFPKDGFPTLQVYGGTPGPELRLITCGGTVAESDGRFSDNVVVFAHAVQG